MFSRASFQPATDDFRFDFQTISPDAKAIQAFVRGNCDTVKVLLGSPRISDDAIRAVRSDDSFVVAIGEVRRQTTVKEISSANDARDMTEVPFGSRPRDVVFLAIPETLRNTFVELLDPLWDVEYNVDRVGGLNSLRSPRASVCKPVPFEVSVEETEQDGQTKSSVVVRFWKPPTMWTDVDRSLFEVIVKDTLQPLVSEKVFDDICDAGIFADAVYQAQLVTVREKFINEFNLQSVSHKVLWSCVDDTGPVLQCPAQEGVVYPGKYEGVPVQPIANTLEVDGERPPQTEV
jgi:hypothetical protein